MVSAGFEEAVQRVTAALQAEGFGIISVIDLHEKFREKLGVSFKKYRILGACNPGYAYQALQAEEKIGTMLPCNVLVIDREDGRFEISAVNPMASMMAVTNPGLETIAREVTEKLKKVIQSV
jgi:uncharacterized protein (DUF302 family)